MSARNGRWKGGISRSSSDQTRSVAHDEIVHGMPVEFAHQSVDDGAIERDQRLLNAPADRAVRIRPVHSEHGVDAMQDPPHLTQGDRRCIRRQLPAPMNPRSRGHQPGLAQRPQHPSYVHRVDVDTARQLLGADGVALRHTRQVGQHVYGDGELSVRATGHQPILPYRNRCGYSLIRNHTHYELDPLWPSPSPEPPELSAEPPQSSSCRARIRLDVVLTTRNPDSLADFASRGASVRRADFSDPASLPTAFAGVDKLLLISTDAGGARLEQHLATIAAASQAGVHHIAHTSVSQPIAANPALVVADHAATEQAIKDSGMAWTMLRNNLHTHMQVPGIEHAAASGQWVANSGAGAAAYVTREDCAAAAAVLTQDGHENQVYDVTGPRAWSAADLAALAGEIGDREMKLVQVDDEAYREGLVQAGLPQAVAGLLTSFGASTRGGFLADVSPAVADLTGRPATELDAVARSALQV